MPSRLKEVLYDQLGDLLVYTTQAKRHADSMEQRVRAVRFSLRQNRRENIATEQFHNSVKTSHTT